MADNIIKCSKEQNYIKGKIGETKAISFLEKLGYKIITKNFKTPLGEIDIVAKDDDERIIFVEVKLRQTAKFGYPRQAVTIQKQKTIRRVAEIFLRSKRITNAYTRFDVIEILADNITHIKSAF